MASEQPKQSRMGLCVGRGFAWIGCVGGGAVFIGIMVAKRLSGPDSLINGGLQEAPIWGPGMMLLAGPLLGFIYYVVETIIVKLLKMFRGDKHE
jgi:hypothetical protein